MSKTILFILLGILFLQTGCGSKNSPTSTGSPAPTYSYPFQFNFGDAGTGNGQFSLVAGIAVSRNTLFVVDAAAGGRVEKFDLNGNFLATFSGSPAFGQPFGIAVDKNGVVYVVDHTNNIIETFDSNGNPLGNFGAAGTGVGQFEGPWGIAVDSAAASIYVTEETNNRFQRCSTSGTGCVTIGGTASGSGNGQFWTPTGIALDGSGNIYVADINNSRIQEFNSSLAFVNKFGSAGSGNGKFGTVSFGIGGLAIDPNGYLLVADTDNKRIEKFTTGGGFLQSIGAPTGGWTAPRMVATDSSNDVYVGDETGDFVSKFAPN
jgi:DNA-binding beta-propeller fold protein YncE